MAGPIRHPRSRVFSMFFLSLTSITRHVEQCSRCCASVGLHFEQCWRQRVPSCSILNMTWTFMMSITSLQFAVHLDPASTWAQVGHKIAQIEEPFGGSPGPSWAQPGPILHVYLHLFPLLFSVWWGFMQGHVPHIGPVLGPTSPDAPTQDQFVCVKPNMSDPSWAEVGPKLELGTS